MITAITDYSDYGFTVIVVYRDSAFYYLRFEPCPRAPIRPHRTLPEGTKGIRTRGPIRSAFRQLVVQPWGVLRGPRQDAFADRRPPARRALAGRGRVISSSVMRP